MIVYVITKGCYSDYHICAVTTDKDKAELMKERYSDKWGNAKIEKFDTNFTEELLRFSNTYICSSTMDNSNVKVCETDIDYCTNKDFIPNKRYDGSLYIYVNANNEQDALKFASEKFAKYKAEKIGL